MRRALALLLFAGLWIGTALAQSVSDTQATLAEWETTASRIETALTKTDALSESTLNELREDLAEWRDRLLSAQSTNETRVETLQSQIDALGPPPPDGETEPEDVASRRSELQEQLAAARAPRVRAEEAFARADTLISQIDRRLRERQADAFFELVATPVNPAIWPEAWQAVRATWADLQSEVRRNVSSETEQAVLRERAPLALGLLALAVLLIARGPRWIGRLQARVAARTSPLAASAWGFLISLGEVLLPVLGLTALITAIRIIGILGDTGTAVAVAINIGILFFTVGRWLARRTFPIDGPEEGPFTLSEADDAEGRFLIRFLSVLLGLNLLIDSIEGLETHSDELISVLSLPVFFLIGIGLYRTARLLFRARAAADEDESGASYALRITGLAAQAVRAVAVVGPIAALIGYYNMAEGILIPTVLSLGLIAAIVAVHSFVRAAWGLAVGLSTDDLDLALVPILVTFAVTVATVPLFALIWGARATDLSEVWTTFVNGFQIGESRLRPGDFLTFLIVFALLFGLTRLVQGALRTSVLPRTGLDKGGQSAVVSGLGYVGITVAVLVGVTSAGLDLSSFALIVGALGVGIGLGLQNIVNNFVSGIIMLIERPVSEGDWVEVNGQMGIVKSISVRSTRIETFDRTDVIVPNGDFISGTVTNWTRGNSVGRVTLSVGVAYGTDTRKVEAILKEISEAHPMVAVDPPPAVFFRRFGADSLEFDVFCILRDVNFKLPVHSDLNHAVHERFNEEGIEIPFAQRDIWLRNPEALRAGGTAVTVQETPEQHVPDENEADSEGDADGTAH